MGRVTHWLKSQPMTVVMRPFLGTTHLQLVGMIAASCKCSSAVALSMAPNGFQEAEPTKFIIRQKDSTRNFIGHIATRLLQHAM